MFSTYSSAITSGKDAIARAITNKGVETAANDTFQQMATNIGNIPGIKTISGKFILFFNTAGMDTLSYSHVDGNEIKYVYYSEPCWQKEINDSNIVKGSLITATYFVTGTTYTISPENALSVVYKYGSTVVFCVNDNFTLTISVGGGGN